MDELKTIKGALSLHSHVARRCMTPLGHVFMLSTSDVLDAATKERVVRSGHSRVPVYRDGDRWVLQGVCQ